MAGRFEVHEHSYVSGPNARWASPGNRLEHSHADGSTGHQHPDTGPAAFTIDKDEWYAATGMKGGGRKAYTKVPSGPQLERVELEPWQTTFEVVFCDTYTPEHMRSAGISEAEHAQHRAEFEAAERGEIPSSRKGKPGRGGAAVARMALGFDMTPTYRVDR